jgi:DNA polymerase IIIc chi subunit
LFFSRFANLIEVVTQDQLIKDNARNRLKKYRDYGFNVNLINYQELTN